MIISRLGMFISKFCYKENIFGCCSYREDLFISKVGIYSVYLLFWAASRLFSRLSLVWSSWEMMFSIFDFSYSKISFCMPDSFSIILFKAVDNWFHKAFLSRLLVKGYSVCLIHSWLWGSLMNMWSYIDLAILESIPGTIDT